MKGRTVIMMLPLVLIAVPLLGPLLVLTEPPQAADAIVVIGGDHKPERIDLAARLYAAGYAPVVVLSAGNVVAEGVEQVPEAEVLRRLALQAGLPSSALLIEDVSLSTFQNAYCTKALVLERGFRSVLLVTSAHQSRRAGRIFREVYGTAVRVRIQAANTAACGLCWWFQPDEVGVVAYEYYNWVRYWLGVRLPAEVPPADGCQTRDTT